VRWEWLHRTDPTRPWQGLGMTMDTEDFEVFQSQTDFRVGMGRVCCSGETDALEDDL
jgi:hypothetical protein